MTNGKPTTIEFAFDRTTPGTARYQEIDAQGKPLRTRDGAVIGTLYIRKTALNGQVPQRIRATIQAV